MWHLCPPVGNSSSISISWIPAGVYLRESGGGNDGGESALAEHYDFYWSMAPRIKRTTTLPWKILI